MRYVFKKINCPCGETTAQVVNVTQGTLKCKCGKVYNIENREDLRSPQAQTWEPYHNLAAGKTFTTRRQFEKYQKETGFYKPTQKEIKELRERDQY
jgi:hypothetical protein